MTSITPAPVAPTKARPSMSAPLRALSVAAALLLTSCGNGGSTDGAPTDTSSPVQTSEQQTITVFAAASLTDVGPKLAEAYKKEHPSVDIKLNLAGSQKLVQQLLAGAEGDVLMTADEESLEPLDGTDVLDGEPTVIAVNQLVLAVPAGSDITGLADLAKPGVTTAICQAQVPCGRVTATVLEDADVTPSATTEEDSVRSVLTKLTSGQVDAALVYRTDAASAGDAVKTIDLPDAPGNKYPVALTEEGADKPAAVEFEKWLTGDEAQQILKDAGFSAPE